MLNVLLRPFNLKVLVRLQWPDRDFPTRGIRVVAKFIIYLTNLFSLLIKTLKVLAYPFM